MLSTAVIGPLVTDADAEGAASEHAAVLGTDGPDRVSRHSGIVASGNRSGMLNAMPWCDRVVVLLDRDATAKSPKE
jgi:hypothetical protein